MNYRWRDELTGEFFLFDPDRLTLTRGGTPVDELSETPARLLRFLIERRHESPVERNDVLERVWQGIAVSDGAYHAAVHRLRHALGDDANNPRYVETGRFTIQWIAPVDDLSEGEDREALPAISIPPGGGAAPGTEQDPLKRALAKRAEAFVRSRWFVGGLAAVVLLALGLVGLPRLIGSRGQILGPGQPSPLAPGVGQSNAVGDMLVKLRLEPNQVLSRDDVRRLADAYGLFRTTHRNPHLRFLYGDVSFFYEQHLTARQLAAQFAARRIVLDAADATGRQISTTGDLSAVAGQWVGRFLSNDAQ